MGLDFYHHVCNSCLSMPEEKEGKPTKFQSCSGCKLVSYCCRSHQKTDWREHKSLCLEVQKLLQNRNRSSLFSCLGEPTHQSLYDFQTSLIDRIEKQLNRNLTFCERSMIYFPDICGKCLKPNGTAYICCSSCHLQFYCSQEDMLSHSVTHGKDCESLKLCFELFQFLSNNSNQPPSKICQKDPVPSIEFPSSLEEYFSRVMHLENTTIFDRVIFSDILSYLLTLIYAIKECSAEFKNKRSLSIHILGATHLESYVLTILEIFFAWMDHVDCLDLVFVGPDCPPSDEDYINSIIEKHADKNLTINFFPGILYHDLNAVHKKVRNADILVAFNCGFHEFKGQSCDSWQNTLDFVLTLKQIILITTSYTLKEAVEDSHMFVGKDEDIECIKLCETNPFKSLNPHRNPEKSESAVFFFNQFISMYFLK